MAPCALTASVYPLAVQSLCNPEISQVASREMDISITEFKQRCLEIVRRVEKTGTSVTIRRRGKAMARLEPSPSAEMAGLKPWEQLRVLGGQLLAQPDESVLRDKDFEALR